MTVEPKCPLCGSSATTIRRKLAASRLVEEWNRSFGIDIEGELEGTSEIQERLCTSCALAFFGPESAIGSPALYQALGKFDWYYMPRKWEHDIAIEDMNSCKIGIEIGCGFGDFVARVTSQKQIVFEGCEQNPSAVELARKKGLSVHLEDAESLAKARPSVYDVVCSFQVLEHVGRPDSFLQAACTLLRPGGKLMLGLPNAESFLRHQFNLLDMPPHHMTRWTADVLFCLPRWFPLRLVRIAYEPLADYHIAGYVEAYSGLLASHGLHVLTLPRIRSSIARLIRASRIQKVLRGQTIYACYVRV